MIGLVPYEAIVFVAMIHVTNSDQVWPLYGRCIL